MIPVSVLVNCKWKSVRSRLVLSETKHTSTVICVCVSRECDYLYGSEIMYKSIINKKL